MSDFIVSMVQDFAGQGYGEQVNENTLWCPLNDRTLLFEPIFEVELDESSEIVGVYVYSNGVLIHSGYYNDEGFDKKFTVAVLSELEVL